MCYISDNQEHFFTKLNELGRVSNYPDLSQFSPPKCLEIFDKYSADKIQFKNYKEVNPPCLMPIRVKVLFRTNILSSFFILGHFCNVLLQIPVVLRLNIAEMSQDAFQDEKTKPLIQLNKGSKSTQTTIIFSNL